MSSYQGYGAKSDIQQMLCVSVQPNVLGGAQMDKGESRLVREGSRPSSKQTSGSASSSSSSSSSSGKASATGTLKDNYLADDALADLKKSDRLMLALRKI